ncbi:MAG: hypothetical protein ABFS46_08890 [Myxococcota bacterium]
MTSHPRPIEPDGLFEGLRWSSIVLGAVLDNVLTLLGYGLLTTGLAGADAFSENEAAAERAFQDVVSSPEFLLLGLLVGVSATVIAAFVGARRAGVHHVRHGGWIAVCSVAFSLVFYLVPGSEPAPSPPVWYEALGWCLLLPSGLAGGYLAARTTRAPSA